MYNAKRQTCQLIFDSSVHGTACPVTVCLSASLHWKMGWMLFSTFLVGVKRVFVGVALQRHVWLVSVSIFASCYFG
jgi:hypothetical protein